MSKRQTSLLAIGIVMLLLVVDQIIKFYIKLHFPLGGSYEVFSWFHLCLVENNGMAFGIELPSKIFLTLFRVAAIGAVAWYLYTLIKNGAKTGYIVLIAFVLAGATGNLIDCLFYGLIFSESTSMEIAQLFPADGGYGTFLQGKVVDMFYFPLIHNSAGETIFFRPVFNFADACITVAVIVIILFYGKDLNESLSKKESSKTE